MNPLRDVLPPTARRIVYAVAFVISLAIGAWQAADGSGVAAAGLFVGMVMSAVAGSNVNGPER